MQKPILSGFNNYVYDCDTYLIYVMIYILFGCWSKHKKTEKPFHVGVKLYVNPDVIQL